MSKEQSKILQLLVLIDQVKQAMIFMRDDESLNRADIASAVLMILDGEGFLTKERLFEEGDI